MNAGAQEMWGISNSNFSGSMGIGLNPSTIVAAPYKYEFNFLGADIFAENTYIYVPQRHHALINGLKGKSSNEKDFWDIYTDQPQKAYAHATVLGPAYISNSGDEAWGAHLNFRNEASASNVYAPLAKYVYQKYDYPPFIGQNFAGGNFAAAYLSWGELGGTYGNVILDKPDNFVKWAGTLNLLLGFDGMYLDARNMTYSLYDSSTAIIHSMDATLAHSLAANGSTGFGSFVKPRGWGLGTTLGATFIHRRNRGGYDCNKTADGVRKYQYRIGLSLMDFGFIHFSGDAQVLNLNSSANRTWSRIDTLKFHSFGHLDTLLSSNINGSATTIVKQSFSMYLPTAISLQFDYSFTPHVYGNLSWVNRIYTTPRQVARGNQLTLTVRYEKRKWEVAGDFSLFEYKVPEAGMGFRYGIFVIGTDRLIELLNLRDLKSFDLFFGFKWNICERKTKSKNSCPAFGNK